MESLYSAIRQKNTRLFSTSLAALGDINYIPEGEDRSALHLSIDLGFHQGTWHLFRHPSLRIEDLYDVPNIMILASEAAPLDVVKKIARNPLVPVHYDWYNGEDSALTPPIHHRDLVRYKWLLYLRGDEFDIGNTVETCEAATDLSVESYDEFLTLALKFSEDPVKTKQELALELEPERSAACIYSLVIFDCDGLLRVSAENAGTSASRFFSVAAKLPMELQMLLCNRLCGIAHDNIPSKLSEPAFKDIAQDFRVSF